MQRSAQIRAMRTRVPCGQHRNERTRRERHSWLICAATNRTTYAAVVGKYSAFWTKCVPFGMVTRCGRSPLCRSPAPGAGHPGATGPAAGPSRRGRAGGALLWRRPSSAWPAVRTQALPTASLRRGVPGRLDLARRRFVRNGRRGIQERWSGVQRQRRVGAKVLGRVGLPGLR